jgi:hypothetical protein
LEQWQEHGQAKTIQGAYKQTKGNDAKKTIPDIPVKIPGVMEVLVYKFL